MQRLRLLGIALLAIFALGSVVSATASAEEGGVPLIEGAKFPLTFTSENAAKTPLTLETSLKQQIVCQNASNKGEFTSGRLGIVTVNFKECKEGKVACQTAKAAKEEIVLENADIHLVDLTGATLRLGLWILPLPNPFKFKCGVIEVEVKGSLLATGETTEGKEEENKEKTFRLRLAKHWLFLWNTTKAGSGEQEFTECDLDKEFCLEKGVHKKFNLESNLGKGFEKAAEIAHILILFPVVVHITW